MSLFLFHLVQDLTKEHTDHVIIELTNGSVRLSLNTGLNTATASLGQGLNDGSWHQITVTISSPQATISVDKDTCIGQGCSKTVVTSSDSRSTFSGLPYFGGVSRLVPQIKEQLLTDSTFVGCIKVIKREIEAVAYEKCQGAHKAKSGEIRSPTCKVLGAAANKIGTQSIFLGATGYWAHVREKD